MTGDELTALRENLGTLVDRMDDFLPAPTVEAGWVLEASGELGRQARAIARVLAIHRPQRSGGADYCSSCLRYTSPIPARVPYPCATVKAIEDAS